jgi:hypothetical protein
MAIYWNNDLYLQKYFSATFQVIKKGLDSRNEELKVN